MKKLNKNKENIIFPFYVKEGDYSPEEGETAIIRGVKCTKMVYNCKYQFFDKKGVINEGAISCWQPDVIKDDLLKCGLDLVEKGIGFETSRKGEF